MSLCCILNVNGNMLRVFSTAQTPLYFNKSHIIPQRVFHFLKVRQYNQYINLDTVFAVCGGGLILLEKILI